MHYLLPRSGLCLCCGKAECPGQDCLPASPLEGWGRRRVGGCIEQAQVKLQGRTRRQEAGFSRKHCRRSRGERDQAQLETIPRLRGHHLGSRRKDDAGTHTKAFLGLRDTLLSRNGHGAEHSASLHHHWREALRRRPGMRGLKQTTQSPSSC